MKLILLCTSLFTMSLGLNAESIYSDVLPGDWQVLGSKKVDKKPEKDVLKVGVNEGGFRKLKLKVTGGKVFIHRMVVTYGNGTKEEINLKHTFKRGSESRIIDLKGDKRIIKQIVFIYDRKNTDEKAKVWVAGR